MKVRDIMTANPETLDINTLVSDVKGKRLRYPVTKNGLFCGVITQADLNRLSALDNNTIGRYMIQNPFTTHPDIEVSTLVGAMNAAPYPARFVPVIDHGFVVGVLTQNTLDYVL